LAWIYNISYHVLVTRHGVLDWWPDLLNSIQWVTTLYSTLLHTHTHTHTHTSVHSHDFIAVAW
jgi:hypothetical protein